MLYAILEGIKSEAVPDTNGFCPFCKKKVFSRCGDVYVWHWAHYAKEGCIGDSFVRPDTYWQKKWKILFGIEKSEILLHKSNQHHVADIFSNGIVMMLYDSRMSKKLIRDIEDFFGEKMFWIVNGEGQGFSMKEKKLSLSYKEYFERTFDIVEDKIVEKVTGEVVDDNRRYIPKYIYSWSSCNNGANTLTEVTKRHVFVDVGGCIFFISVDTGECKEINLEAFLKKYRCNLSFDYTKLTVTERKSVRGQYIEKQKGLCLYCGCSLKEESPEYIKSKKINWDLFPENFLKYPIHLQHNHDTGITEGAVHNYCNAVMWQYEGR